MPFYIKPDGQKVWWGKGFTISGIIAGTGIAAIGTGLLGSCLTDLIERYQENYISIREAQKLFVESGLAMYALYCGIEAIPKKWRELQRMGQFEQQHQRKIKGDDYPYFYG